jgi:hypothetical protein
VFYQQYPNATRAAREVLHQLEIAHDHRLLAPHEDELRGSMKLKTLELSSLQQTIARQESRLLWLSEGDTLTNFFHVQANARHRCKHIRSLVHNDQVLWDEDSKAEAAFHFFNEILSTPVERQHTLRLDALDLSPLNLADLDERFTEAEVLDVIRSLPPDKASRPDGFTTRFLQTCWATIWLDLMAAFDAFWRLDTRNFHDVNGALLSLLPKSPEAETPKDFRPISLIHLMGKLFSKVLANCLESCLSSLIHPAQSALIKGRFIQDNFRVVQSTTRLLHA